MTVKLLSEDELRALLIEPDGSCLTLSHSINGDQIPRLLAVARWAAKARAKLQAQGCEYVPHPCGSPLQQWTCARCALLAELTPPTPEER